MEPLKRSPGARDEIAHRSRHQGSPDDPVPLIVRYSKNACRRSPPLLRWSTNAEDSPELPLATAAKRWLSWVSVRCSHAPQKAAGHAARPRVNGPEARCYTAGALADVPPTGPAHASVSSISSKVRPLGS